MNKSQTHLSKRPRRHNNLIHSHRRNHNHRRPSNAPAQHIRPRRIHIILVHQRRREDQSVHDDEQQEYRSHKLPANSPVNARSETDHIADVLAKPIRSVDPRNGNRLEEHGDQYRIAGRVSIEQLEIVETALRAAGQSDDKVHGEQDCDEHFAVAADLGEFIAERSDDGLGAAELDFV